MKEYSRIFIQIEKFYLSMIYRLRDNALMKTLGYNELTESTKFLLEIPTHQDLHEAE